VCRSPPPAAGPSERASERSNPANHKKPMKGSRGVGFDAPAAPPQRLVTSADRRKKASPLTAALADDEHVPMRAGEHVHPVREAAAAEVSLLADG
jgi:hypothetical protein